MISVSRIILFVARSVDIDSQSVRVPLGFDGRDCPDTGYKLVSPED